MSEEIKISDEHITNSVIEKSTSEQPPVHITMLSEKTLCGKSKKQAYDEMDNYEKQNNIHVIFPKNCKICEKVFDVICQEIRERV